MSTHCWSQARSSCPSSSLSSFSRSSISRLRNRSCQSRRDPNLHLQRQGSPKTRRLILATARLSCPSDTSYALSSSRPTSTHLSRCKEERNKWIEVESICNFSGVWLFEHWFPNICIMFKSSGSKFECINIYRRQWSDVCTALLLVAGTTLSRTNVIMVHGCVRNLSKQTLLRRSGRL